MAFSLEIVHSSVFVGF